MTPPHENTPLVTTDQDTSEGLAFEPFSIHVAQTEIDDLRRRIGATRWPEEIPGSGWTYGSDLETIRRLASYWETVYDWRTHEAELNRYPQFTTEILGQRIHFIHVRSARDDALPLILTHGWPGSVSEFTQLIGPLTDPESHGASGADAFHVVIPSLPGYGFSGPTDAPGWDIRKSADAWAELMAGLGYERYGAQGGDWGSMLTRQLGDVDPDHLVGMHVNLLVGLPPGKPDDFEDLTEAESLRLARFNEYMQTGQGYVALQASKPQTLAFGLLDSPVGLLSWIAEKFWAWTDNDGQIEDAITLDELLTNVSIYWFTRTAGSSARMYYESMATMSVVAPPTTRVPLGVASFPKEVLMARRRWIEDTNQIAQWSEFDRGGHFAALEEPDLLVDDIREFFRPLR
jgi:pimeloyl-ACP methyl ester carboxylesterase